MAHDLISLLGIFWMTLHREGDNLISILNLSLCPPPGALTTGGV